MESLPILPMVDVMDMMVDGVTVLQRREIARAGWRDWRIKYWVRGGDNRPSSGGGGGGGVNHGVQGVAVHLGSDSGGGVLRRRRDQGWQFRRQGGVPPAEIDTAVITTQRARGTGRVWVANVVTLAVRGVVTFTVRPRRDVGTLIGPAEG